MSQNDQIFVEALELESEKTGSPLKSLPCIDPQIQAWNQGSIELLREKKKRKKTPVKTRIKVNQDSRDLKTPKAGHFTPIQNRDFISMKLPLKKKPVVQKVPVVSKRLTSLFPRKSKSPVQLDPIIRLRRRRLSLMQQKLFPSQVSPPIWNILEKSYFNPKFEPLQINQVLDLFEQNIYQYPFDNKNI